MPVEALLVFNGSWTASECPSPGDVGKSRFSDFCDSIVSNGFLKSCNYDSLLQMKPFSDRLFLSDPSLISKNADKGKSIGDDVCW